MWACGDNSHGQLGVGKHFGKLVSTLEPVSQIKTRILQVAAGYRHTLVLCDSQLVYGMGSNLRSELNHASGK